MNALGISWLALVSSLLFGCAEAAPGATFHSGQQFIIVGEDDRVELHEFETETAQAVLSQSVVALMYAHRLKFDVDGAAELRATSLTETLNLCEDEAFGEQPTAAYCTGVLVDKDLVLTAGHCMGGDIDEGNSRCQRTFIVFDYRMDENGGVRRIDGQDTYACREVMYHRRMSNAEDFLDLALLRLDRPVSSERAPAELASTPPQVGDDLVLASHGAGLPLKAQPGATVTETPEGTRYFVAATDSFAGGSGAPLFNAALQLVGHQVRGELDWEIAGGCRRAARTDVSNEQHQDLRATLAALCAENLGSERLCGQAPECGDSLCNGDEDSAACSQDCPAASCGDALCELSEHTACSQDCAAFDGVPAWWNNDPGDYIETPAPNTSGSDSDSGCIVAPGPSPADGVPVAASSLCLFGAVIRRRYRRHSRHSERS